MFVSLPVSLFDSVLWLVLVLRIWRPCKCLLKGVVLVGVLLKGLCLVGVLWKGHRTCRCSMEMSLPLYVFYGKVIVLVCVLWKGLCPFLNSLCQENFGLHSN